MIDGNHSVEVNEKVTWQALWFVGDARVGWTAPLDEAEARDIYNRQKLYPNERKELVRTVTVETVVESRAELKIGNEVQG